MDGEGCIGPGFSETSLDRRIRFAASAIFNNFIALISLTLPVVCERAFLLTCLSPSGFTALMFTVFTVFAAVSLDNLSSLDRFCGHSASLQTIKLTKRYTTVEQTAERKRRAAAMTD